MKILVTAGNTQTPIDQVRCITNIFSGRTGALIAWEGAKSGHHVTFLTSHPEVLSNIQGSNLTPIVAINVRPFQTFDNLHQLMAEEIQTGEYDAIIHAAAVSDFECAGVFAPTDGTRFLPDTKQWQADDHSPAMTDVLAGKIKSKQDEVWIRLVPAPKLVDKIRRDWHFRGVLVKFKLEVGLTERELMEVAEKARKQSSADYIVANTLEGMHEKAFLGDANGHYREIPRATLARTIMSLFDAPFSHGV